MSIKYVQSPTLYLAGAGVVIGATSAVLTSLTDIYGNILTMTDFGDLGYITFEPETSNAESATFAGITANSNGTYTLTGLKSSLAKNPYTETSGLVRGHAGGTKVVVTDTVAFWNTFANKKNDETIDGQWTFTNTPITPPSISDASTTVKGVTKLSVAPAVAANPIALGSNDPVALAGAGTQGVPSATNTFVTKDNTSAASTDQTQTTQNGTIEVGEANVTTKKNQLAQSFIPTKTKIRGVTFYKSADTGTFTGTVTVSIRSDSSGSPSGSDLISYTYTNAQWTALTTGQQTVIFATEYTSLIAGSLYWIAFSTSTSDTSNHPNVGTNTAGGYSSGSVKYRNSIDGWVAISTIDLYFTTLEGNTNQVVKTDSNGKIPNTFFDTTGSAFLPVFQQQVYMGDSTSAQSYCYASTSNADGSVIYASLQFGTSNLYRFARDVYTGMYYQTNSVNTNVSGIVLLGAYIYVFTDVGATFTATRYLASDLSGATAMTFGTTTGATAPFLNCFTDGTYIYLQENGGSTFRKYSVSGTTFTQVSTLTGDADILSPATSYFYDGTQIVFVRNSVSGSISVGKFTDPTSVPAPTVRIQHSWYQFFNSGTNQERYAPIIANIDSNRMYIGGADVTVDIDDSGYTGGSMMYLVPISKP